MCAVNNFGTGSPGVTKFLIPKGLFSISNISYLNDAIIVRSHFIYFITIFLSGNVENLPLTFIAAASGGGAFVLIIVAVICFAFVVRGRR